MIQTKIYKNGLRLVFEKSEKSVSCVNIMFNVGSQNEEKHQEGYAHFIEHMIFKGTKKINSVEIMDRLTFLGADFNAYTSKTMTKFVFKCLNENFVECFEIYCDILLNAEFEQEELDRERQVVIEEMKRCDDEPVEIMYKQIMNNYFNGLSYAHDELGQESIIESVSREELLMFKNKYYKPENCIISIVGNFDFKMLDKVVENNFSKFFDYEARPLTVDSCPYDIKISKVYDIVERDDNQANVGLLIKSVTSFDEEKHVCDLYTSILGNSQNSRLFKRIREKLGLVYTIYAYNEMSTKSGGLMIVFGTRPKNVKKAMLEIKKEILKFAQYGVEDEELLRAKNWKKSCLSFGLETNSNIAEVNGTIFNLYNKKFDINDRLKKIERVTKEDIDKFAKRIANEKQFVVVAVGKGLSLSDIETI